MRQRCLAPGPGEPLTSHLTNVHATLLSTLYLTVAGLFLGSGFVLTGDLAISIGLHVAWNSAQGHGFGFPVSGGSYNLSLLATQQGGPDAWTGGAFGLEGGLIGLLAILLGALLVYGWVRWTRGRAAVRTELAQYEVLARDAA